MSPGQRIEFEQWEYRVVEGNPDLPELQSQLNALGVRGWELVGFSTASLEIAAKVDTGATGFGLTQGLAHTLVFKRRLGAVAPLPPPAEPSPPSPTPSPQGNVNA